MKITLNKKEEARYKDIQIEEPTVRDIIIAEQASGVSEGIKFDAALIAQCTTFDGQKLVMEDVEQFSRAFFFELKDALMDGQLKELVKELLSSPENGTSDTEK